MTTRGSDDPAARVLAGLTSYDALAEEDQVIVREAWEERIAETLLSLNFEDELLSDPTASRR